MRAEESFFLRILADYAMGRDTPSVPADCDMETVLTLAKKHCVSGIVYKQLRGLVGGSVFKRLEGEFAGEVFFAQCYETDYAELSAALTQAGIEFLPFKGMELARYHPVPQLRSKGDIDLAIHPADRERSDALLRSLGYAVQRDFDEVWSYKRDVVSYELHTHIFYGELLNDFDYRAYFDTVWEHTDNGHITPEFQFVYFMAHTARHIQESGNGFRAFLDMLIAAKYAPLDWDYVQTELEKIRLLDFTRVCFGLCEYWFGEKMPLDARTPGESFAERATVKVLEDGIFGHDNAQNEVAAEAKSTEKSKLPYFLAAILSTLRAIFPPYRVMRCVPWYSFLDGRPWLLPAAWVYRLFYCVKNKLTQSKRKLVLPYLEREQIDERRRFLHEWGL